MDPSITGRQPRASHDFFVKHQHRILFGKDSYQPDEFWKLCGIGLPDQVVKKLYNGNALKLTPGLSHFGVTD